MHFLDPRADIIGWSSAVFVRNDVHSRRKDGQTPWLQKSGKDDNFVLLHNFLLWKQDPHVVCKNLVVALTISISCCFALGIVAP